MASNRRLRIPIRGAGSRSTGDHAACARPSRQAKPDGSVPEAAFSPPITGVAWSGRKNESASRSWRKKLQRRRAIYATKAFANSWLPTRCANSAASIFWSIMRPDSIPVDSILDLSTEQFDATFKTNLYEMFWITKATLPHFTAGASIINTPSVLAYNPAENLLDYAQTKAAIVSFTKSLAKQLGEKGICVNAVAPGPVWTSLQVSGGQLPSALETFGAYTPMGRPGQPAELAAVYVTLASQESSYTSGQVYGVSGGSGNP